MSAFVTLDQLIGQENGDTFFFDGRTCPLSLLKEVILRGFQICELDPFKIHEFQRFSEFGLGGFTLSEGLGEGSGFKEDSTLRGVYEGYGHSVSSGNGSGNGCMFYGFDVVAFRWNIQQTPDLDYECRSPLSHPIKRITKGPYSLS